MNRQQQQPQQPQQRTQPRHFLDLSAIKRLEICGSAIDPGSDPSRPAITLGQQVLSVHFLTQQLPFMMQLTRLDLTSLSISFMQAAVACLGQAAPTSLASLRMQDPSCDQPLSGPSTSHLWPALAGLATLQSLHLVAGFCRQAELRKVDLPGLSCISQLRSLSIRCCQTCLFWLLSPRCARWIARARLVYVSWHKNRTCMCFPRCLQQCTCAPFLVHRLETIRRWLTPVCLQVSPSCWLCACLSRLLCMSIRDGLRSVRQSMRPEDFLLVVPQLWSSAACCAFLL